MNPPQAVGVPLVIDLDGTLVAGDLLHESALELLRTSPAGVLALPGWLAAGKARLKQEIARRVEIDVANLPYDPALLEHVRAERAGGRRTVLCTASDERLARAVAGHLGCFDEVLASDGTRNLAGARKAELLVERFGRGGFDYAGNSSADLPVWAAAREAIVVAASPALVRRARGVASVARVFERPVARLAAWARALRLHQWLKNLLVFLPLLGAHRLGDFGALQRGVAAFVAFGLAASAVYLVNDLADLQADRRHPRKRRRPFAAGELPAPAGIAVAALLVAGAALLAWRIGPAFAGWLGVYLAATVAYTFWLKRKLLLDAITLAGLYVLRIVAGGVAVGVVASFWLLGFALFLFLSLAFVKRYSELLVMAGEGEAGAAGRGYLAEDLHLIQTFGVTAGFAAVVVLALYLTSDAVLRLYRTPEALGLALPLVLYWIGRMWVQAHRGRMHDDPLLHAVRDRTSLLCGAAFVALMWVASRAW